MMDPTNQSPQCEDEANTGAAFNDDDRDSTVQRESLASLNDGMEPNLEKKDIDRVSAPIYAGGSGSVERRILDVKEAWHLRGRYAIRERGVTVAGPSPLRRHSSSSVIAHKRVRRERKATKEHQSEGEDAEGGQMTASPSDAAKCQDFGRRKSCGEIPTEGNTPARTLHWVAEKQNLHQLSSLTRRATEHTETHASSPSSWISQKQNKDPILPSSRAYTARSSRQQGNSARIEVGINNDEEGPPSAVMGTFFDDDEQQERRSSSREHSELQPPCLWPGAYAINGANSNEEEQQIDDTEQQANYGFPEHDIAVVATLVDHDGHGHGGEEHNSPSVVAIAQQVKFGINFSDRRTWMVLCFVVLAFVGLAVGLTFGTVGQSDGAVAGLTSNMGVSADGKNAPTPSSQLPSSAPMIWPSLEPSGEPTLSTMPTSAPTGAPTLSQRPSSAPTIWPSLEPSGKPTLSTMPTLSPTIWPSPEPSGEPTLSTKPTSAPTGAPTSLSWDLLGDHINGDGPEGEFGLSVSMSTDGSIVGSSFQETRYVSTADMAVPYMSLANLNRLQQAETNTGTEHSWTNLVGELRSSPLDFINSFMSLSGDGSIAAISYAFTKSFSSKGTVIDIFDLSLSPGGIIQASSSVLISNSSITNPPTLLSEDGRVLFVLHDRLLTSYHLDPDPKLQVGSLEGEGALSTSANGTVLAVADFYSPPNGGTAFPGARVVKVFQRNDSLNTWDQVGSEFGHSTDVITTAMSADGRIVAVGQPLELCFGDDWGGVDWRCGLTAIGQVKVYRLLKEGWKLMGNPMKSDVGSDEFGGSVSLSGDGLILAVGAKKNKAGRSPNSGLVRVYRYSKDINKWTQVGGDIHRTESGEEFGTAVALSGDGRRLAVGAPKNRAEGLDAGRVSVFQLMEYS